MEIVFPVKGELSIVNFFKGNEERKEYRTEINKQL